MSGKCKWFMPLDRQNATSCPLNHRPQPPAKKLHASGGRLPEVPDALQIVLLRGAGAANTANECAPIHMFIPKKNELWKNIKSFFDGALRCFPRSHLYNHIFIAGSAFTGKRNLEIVCHIRTMKWLIIA